METIFVDDHVGIFAVASTWICTVIINFIPAPINFFRSQFATHDSKGLVFLFLIFYCTVNFVSEVCCTVLEYTVSNTHHHLYLYALLLLTAR